MKEGERLSLWLAIRDDYQFGSVIGRLIGMLVQHRSKAVALRIAQPDSFRTDSPIGRAVDPKRGKMATVLLRI